MVYVISKDGKPLMPTQRHGKVRRWLRDGKARVVRRTPFTIKLLFETGDKTQDLNLGIDPGSKTVGTAVRINDTKKVVYSSEVKLRTDIKKKMDRRRNYRKTRRNRKTRHRKPRFLNRTRKEGWLPPSVQSKVDSTKKEIKFIFSILPIKRVIFEYSKFDIHKMTNKFVKGFWYQLGNLYGWESTKAYVLSRDNYKCQACKGKSKDPRLQVHHVKYKRNGGTNKPTNLLTLCSTCHKQVHSSLLILTKKQLQSCVNTKDATQVSIISKRIWEFLKRGVKIKDFKLVRTYGFVTKVKRRLLKIRKDHNLDALACTYPKKDHYRKGLRKPRIKSNSYTKICVNEGDYKLTFGKRGEKKIVARGKYKGFRKFDVVKYLGQICIIRGMMAPRYAFLRDKEGKDLKLKPLPKFESLIRLQGRSSWIIFQS